MNLHPVELPCRMIGLPDFDDSNTPEAYLRTRTDAEIRELEQAFPVVINDASNPQYELARLIHAEGRGRRLW